MMKQITAIVALLLVSVLGAALVQAIPATIDEVQLDDTTVSPNAINRLNIERNEEFEVEVRLTAQQDISDVEVEAFVSGYEYNDYQDTRISDVTPLFDMESNVTYVKRLTLQLPGDADRDDYKVRIIVSDRNGQELIQNYNLKIDASRHNIVIDDVILNPSSEVRSGSALLATVRVENFGQDDEEDVKVTASIPALGISASDYIDEIKDDDQKDSEELYMRIPRCAKAGTYDLSVDVEYNRGHDVEHKVWPIKVVEDDTCTADAPKGVPSTMIILGTQLESAAQGGNVIFPITLSNSGKGARSYTVTITGADWADVKLSPASTVVVEAGKSQTVNAFVTVKDDATVGPHTMTATVTSGTEKLEDLTLTVNVSKGKSSGWETFKKALVVILIVLVALLVILGLIIGISRMKNQDDESGKAQTYY
ncbi:MAG: hypothetical protein AABY13_01705 [Nanoarchaeota archaeon]